MSNSVRHSLKDPGVTELKAKAAVTAFDVRVLHGFPG